jgi:Ring finger domain
VHIAQVSFEAVRLMIVSFIFPWLDFTIRCARAIDCDVSLTVLLFLFQAANFCCLYYSISSLRLQNVAMSVVESLPAPLQSDQRLITDMCPICLGGLTIADGAEPDDCHVTLLNRKTMQKSVSCVTVCGHLYHRTCLTQWLRKDITCPVCRRTFN